jgi:hypothetical protein
MYFKYEVGDIVGRHDGNKLLLILEINTKMVSHFYRVLDLATGEVIKYPISGLELIYAWMA